MKVLSFSFLFLFAAQVSAGTPAGEWSVSADSRRAAILIGGAEGGLAWQYLPQQVEALQQAGFSVFRTAYFNHAGTSALLQEIELDYFRRVIEWVAEQNDDLVIVAHSRGSEAALLSAIGNDKVDKLVVIAPASHVFQGIERSLEATVSRRRSAWAEAGQPLPFVPFDINQAQMEETALAAEKGEMCACVLDVYRQSLAKAAAETRIAVESIDATVLFVSSDSDPIWPSAQMADTMMASRQQAGKRSEHWRLQGGHMPHADGAVWQRIVDWLH
ncbi:alpha/beta fold hydrolase [Pseudomarimonas arenosa]|uniref:Alpha/beta fold hydrolase n=1 Tax=Pseudomarimonas arenosa TaxID=2774145 RepID=A0AAW3ZK11_9GAMM|nr:alpha/beta fold hydrolase [Pseudomarimonas arenosa]MBD8525044.1 alpha/beta fold hydrolase [Pseudomarimonas arenosa]